MSRFDDIILDVEPLYEAGYNAESISILTGHELELVDQTICYLEERAYHKDMETHDWDFPE